MVENCWSPFYSVNLSHQCTIDGSGSIEQLITIKIQSTSLLIQSMHLPGPIWIFGKKHIADRIVLQGEQGVHQFQSQPPICVEPGLWKVILVSRQEVNESFSSQKKLAIRGIFAERNGDRFRRPINLGGIPPAPL